MKQRMLLKLKDLQGDAIHAEDGEVGSLDDLYFDDEEWDVRYLVVNARRWIPRRKYLVPPIAIDRERPLAGGEIRVELTREQIARCPTAADESHLRSSAVRAHRLAAGESPFAARARRHPAGA